MSVQFRAIGSILVVTGDLSTKYAMNFFDAFGANGDAITVTTQATAATIKLSGMALRKTASVVTGDGTAGLPALDSEAGALVLSLPAYTTSDPIPLANLIDYLDVTTDPVLPGGICVTLFRAAYNGRERTSDYVY